MFSNFSRSTSICGGIALMTLVLLSACGGGSSSSTTTTTSNVPNTSGASNVALASKGAVATSSFSGNESFVIDGDTSTINFWEPGANNDTITIDFSQSYAVSRVQIYSMNMTGSNDFTIEFSENGTDFNLLDFFSDCLNLSFGSSGYSCDLNQLQDARYVRLTILQKADIIDIYEIEVQGE